MNEMRANYIITNRSISVTFDGKTLTVSKEDDAEKYSAVLKAIKEDRLDTISAIFEEKKILVSEYTDGNLQVIDGQVHIKSLSGEDQTIPLELNEMLMDYIKNEIPYLPLVNFVFKLNQNPSYRSVQQLFSFLVKNHFTITDSGNFIAYKGVRGNFTDCHTGKMDNSIGVTVKMPRNQVNEDPNQTCSSGLHVANYDYAFTMFGNGNERQVVMVEVDPKNVVSVPIDYNCAKMRTCEYKVIGLAKGELKERVYCSNDDDDDDDDDDDGRDCNCCGLDFDQCGCSYPS